MEVPKEISISELEKIFIEERTDIESDLANNSRSRIAYHDNQAEYLAALLHNRSMLDKLAELIENRFDITLRIGRQIELDRDHDSK